MRLPRPTLLLALSTLTVGALGVAACGDKDPTDDGGTDVGTDTGGGDTDTDTDGTDTDTTDTDADTDGTDTDVDTDTDGGETDADSDGYPESEDCNDDDATVNPGATEIWYDGVDQDCDGADDYDQDGDGEGAQGYAEGGDDCDDTDATIGPDATDIVGDGIDQDCDGIDATTSTKLEVRDLTEGDLIITEIMANPEASTEEAGEWVEILNNTGLDLDLNGLELRDDDEDSATVDRPLGVPAGGLVVLGRSDDTAVNGGVDVAWAWGDAMALGNGIDELELLALGTEVDRVAWDDGFSFPDVAGATMSLDPAFTDALDNDFGAVWCAGQDAFGDGDLGSPGDINPTCPDIDDTDDDGDGYPAAIDCDDGDATVFPGAEDTPYDGVDADCAGDSDYDADGDGFDAEDYGGRDCDDTEAATYPGAPDTDGDGVDSDCDGEDGAGSGDGGSDSGGGDGGTDTGAVDAAPIDDLEVGELFITEIMQNPAAVGDESGEWFEIYNLHFDAVNLDGLVITDADTDSHTVRGTVIVEPGQYVVLGNNSDPATNGGVDVAYEFSGISLGNGADELILSNAGGVIDEVSYDGGTDWPDPTGASMNLDTGSLSAADNDAGANWCASTVSFGSGDLGTPGAENIDCDGGSGDSGSGDSGSGDSGSGDSGGGDGGDSGSTDSGSTDSGSTDSGSTDSGGGDGGGDTGTSDLRPVTDLGTGDLIITEIMQNPDAVGDSVGEWFEIVSNRDEDYDLDGLVIEDAGGESHTVSGTVVLEGRGTIVLGNNSDSSTNGGLAIAYEYSGFNLGNGDDEIILSSSSGVIDQVEYDGGTEFPDPTGASMNLDPGLYSYTDNDVGISWCEATSIFGDGDLGSPGSENDACESGGGDSGGGDSGGGDSGGGDSGGGDSGGGDSGGGDTGTSDLRPVTDLGTGDLLITEIMQNPAAVGDSVGEWFEIVSNRDEDYDLNGLVIEDAGGESHTVSGTLVLEGRGTIVLGNNSDSSTNGGVDVAYQYSGFNLGNGDDEIILSSSSGVIDQVEYDGGTEWPDPTGASMTLDPSLYDHASNDAGISWCEATSSFGDGDLGTPGADNDACESGGGDSGGDSGASDSGASDSGASDSGASDSGSGDGGGDTGTSDLRPVTDLGTGDLVITEIMQNPNAVGDSVGEWFEIVSLRDEDYDLDGLVIEDAGGETHTVSGTVVLEARGTIVLGNNSDSSTNGGVAIAYQYSDFNLGNGDDEIILSSSSGVIDQVEYDGGSEWPDPTGASMSLDPSLYDHASNDAGISWCEATSAFGDGDLGSPGENNDPCESSDARSIDDFGPGDLLITEIMQNPAAVDDSLGEWIELYNTRDEAVDLEGLVLSDADGESHTVASSVVVEPGTFVVLGASDDEAANGGVAVSYAWSDFNLGNGADEVILSNSSGDLDQVDYDGGAEFPDPTGASMNLDDGAFDRAANDFGVNWCASTASFGDGDLGTPGAANETCPDGSGDSGSGDSGSGDSGGGDTGTTADFTVDDLTVGDLIITEIMQNPSAVDDSVGEWFEVLNISGGSVDLDGLVITDDGGETHTISGTLVVPNEDVVILGNNSDYATNGNVDVDYQYSGFNLGNGADEVILSNGAGVLDEVAYDGGTDFPDPSGASMNLDPRATSTTDNDDGANWCASTESFGAGDLGSPGGFNEFCGTSSGDSGGGDTGGGDSGGGDTGSGSELSIDDVAVGEIFVTEIMQNPNAVGDSLGEWFEIYNATGADVDLYGMVISDADGESHTVSEHIILGSPGAAVLGNNSDSSTNGGLTVDYQYSSFNLGNGADEIILSNGSGVIDEVSYDGGTDWPDPTGASMNLTLSAASATGNDDGANWCATSSASVFGDGDYGTPNAINETCE